MSTYEPGTVAVATVRGVGRDVRVVFCGGTDFCWLVPDTCVHVQPHDVTDVRVLPVLDPEEFGGASFIVGALRRCPTPNSVSRALADEIERQTAEPRIPEPGLYGVVSAHIGKGGPWVLTRSEHGWVCLDDGTVHDWDSLIDPTLVRPGIEEAS